MLSATRRHINYANVVATLALVFSMSGAAFAANHYLIHSTKQISPKVLKQLRGHNGKRGANGATGSAGPKGETGAKGERGEQGPSEAFEVALSKNTAITPNESSHVLTLQNLPAGAYVISAQATFLPKAKNEEDPRCQLTAGSEADNVAIPIFYKQEEPVSASAVLTHVFTSTGTTALVCESVNNNWLLEGAEHGSTRIVAVRVGALRKEAREAT